MVLKGAFLLFYQSHKYFISERFLSQYVKTSFVKDSPCQEARFSQSQQGLSSREWWKLHLLPSTCYFRLLVPHQITHINPGTVHKDQSPCGRHCPSPTSACHRRLDAQFSWPTRLICLGKGEEGREGWRVMKMMTMMIGLYVCKWLDVDRKETFFLISVESVVGKMALSKWWSLKHFLRWPPACQAILRNVATIWMIDLSPAETTEAHTPVASITKMEIFSLCVFVL